MSRNLNIYYGTVYMYFHVNVCCWFFSSEYITEINWFILYLSGNGILQEGLWGGAFVLGVSVFFGEYICVALQRSWGSLGVGTSGPNTQGQYNLVRQVTDPFTKVMEISGFGNQWTKPSRSIWPCLSGDWPIYLYGLFFAELLLLLFSCKAWWSFIVIHCSLI